MTDTVKSSCLPLAGSKEFTMKEMTPDVEAFANRLKSLERQNRLTRYVGALLFSVMVLGWVGKAETGIRGKSGKPGTREALPMGDFESLTTRQFQLVDDNGKARATLGMSQEVHSKVRVVELRLTDETGESSISLDAGGFIGPALNVYRAGAGSVRVAMNGTNPLLQLSDDKGKVSAVLWFMNGSPHLVLTDKRGRTRAVFGYEAAWPSGPGRPDPTPSVMAVYDEKGQVVWSATQRESKEHKPERTPDRNR